MAGHPKSDEYVEIEVRCPNCNSDKVVVCEDSHGHFQVIQCYNCGYKKNCELEEN